MSKARKRYLRKLRAKARKSKVSSHNDIHHLFFWRSHWRGAVIGELRQHPYCKVLIPRETLHKMIHEAVPCVPVPSPENVRDVIFQLRNLEKYGAIGPDDSLEKRLKVLISLFEYAEDPTAEALKAQLEVAERFYKPP